MIKLLMPPEYTPCNTCKSSRDVHGRSENLEIWVYRDVSWLPQIQDWKGLASVILVRRQWKTKGKFQEKQLYYISSLKADPKRHSEIIRRHRSIENKFHWQLEVTFREDASKIGWESSKNLRTLRLAALDLLKKDTADKKSLKSKVRRCHRSEDYLKHILLLGNF